MKFKPTEAFIKLLCKRSIESVTSKKMFGSDRKCHRSLLRAWHCQKLKAAY